MSLKDTLKEKLTEDELKKVKRSFDTIGNIAIIEIPKELIGKEKMIADALLKTHKNITTVLKKAGVHKGKYRTQKLKVIGGKNTKETIYRESGVTLKLDVEKVYFSPRSGTERRRIAQLVQPEEEILVMFSGCAPFPLVLSKNSKAGRIYGIELNPTAHKYAVENIGLNRARNVILLKGDVRKTVPKLLEQRMQAIGLKSSIDEDALNIRLKAKPKILELFIRDGELQGKKMQKALAKLKNLRIKTMLHLPSRHNNVYAGLGGSDDKKQAVFKVLRHALLLAKKYNNITRIVFHPYNCKKQCAFNTVVDYEDKKISKESLIQDLNELYAKMPRLKKYLCLENLTWACFSKKEDIIEVMGRTETKKMCLDIVHLFLTYENNAEQFEQALKELSEKYDCYFHIADTRGTDDTLHTRPIGEGAIPIERITKFIGTGIIEVTNYSSEITAAEMLQSYDTYQSIIKNINKFDRILMPLPKGGEHFLDVAISASRKGTVLHFYDFAREEELPNTVVDKIKKACEKAGREYEVIKIVKCGDFGPRIYRVCADVLIK